MKTPPPKTDPNLGVWTNAYVQWALSQLTHEEFESIYKCSKLEASEIAEVEYVQHPKGDDGEPPLQELEEAQRKEDLESMHHATFKKKYDVSNDEYKKLKDNS